MPNEKHAYLILCHQRFHQLGKLLELLDDERNDIYVHVDKKAGAYPEKELREAVKKSGLFFTERIWTSWGGYSQIEAELVLLRTAVNNPELERDGGYAYYHLISGMDLPIKTQDEIHSFFDGHSGMEFLCFYRQANEDRELLERISHYWFLQEFRGNFREKREAHKIAFYYAIAVLQKTLDKAQRLLRVDRLGKDRDMFFWGANWFDITHAFATYVLTQKAFIEKRFRYAYCPDELMLQSLLMNSSFRDSVIKRNLRFVDWERGTPYVFRLEDYDLLMSSDCLFARKFDEDKDPEIIEKISRELRRRSAKSEGGPEC